MFFCLHTTNRKGFGVSPHNSRLVIWVFPNSNIFNWVALSNSVKIYKQGFTIFLKYFGLINWCCRIFTNFVQYFSGQSWLKISTIDSSFFPYGIWQNLKAIWENYKPIWENCKGIWENIIPIWENILCLLVKISDPNSGSYLNFLLWWYKNKD